MLAGFLKDAYKKYLPWTYYAELRKAVKGCTKLLDVGCGSDSPVRYFADKIYCVGVDLHEASIEESKKQGIHNDYYLMDVLEIQKKFAAKSFDCVLASDVIEHLTKEDGLKLLEMMEAIAKKRVIVFTPNGFLPQGEYDDNPWQVHKSGWEITEMEARGYRVIGINGYKSFRGEYADIRLRPKLIWRIVAELSQFLVRNHPRYAFQILCVKEQGI
jgi:predicted TPR repeat methyltransferase